MRLRKLVGWPDKDDEGWLGPMAGSTEADGPRVRVFLDAVQQDGDGWLAGLV